jgi:hypothetical protein
MKFKIAVVLLWGLGCGSLLHAQSFVGTYVKQGDANAGGGTVMTVAPCCGSGYHVTWHLPGPQPMTLSLDSKFDGSDAPLLMEGKPSGVLMAVKLVDNNHSYTIFKMDGKEIGTSTSAMSKDGKTISVENDYKVPIGVHPAGKQSETYVRK